MASGSRPISHILSEDPYSNHQLLPVPYNDRYHAAWELFCQNLKLNSSNRIVYCSKEVFNKWFKFRDIHTNPPPPEETPQPLPKHKEPKRKLKEPTMMISTHKSCLGRLLPPPVIMMEVRKTSPIGGRICSFTSWDMLVSQMKERSLPFYLTKGDAAFWVQAKKEDVIKGNLRTFNKFKTQLEQ